MIDNNLEYPLVEFGTEDIIAYELNTGIDPRSVQLSFIGVTNTSLTFRLIGLSGYSKARGVTVYGGGKSASANVDAYATSSGDMTLTGLASGTTYSITWNLWGDYPLSGSRSATTSGSPPDSTPPVAGTPSTNMPTSGFTTSTTWNATCYVSDNVAVTYAAVYVGNTLWQQRSISITGGNVSFSGMSLPSNGIHNVSFVFRDAAGNVGYSPILRQPFYYDVTAPTITNTAGSFSNGVITAACTASDNLGFASIQIFISARNSTTIFSTGSNVYTSYSSGSHSFRFSTDAQGNAFQYAGSKYYIKFTAFDKAGNSRSSLYEITPTLTKPAAFEWSAAQLSAMRNKGNFSVMTTTSWNTFLDRVQSAKCWYENNPNAVNLQGNKIASGKSEMSASSFNAVRIALGSIVSTGIGTKVRGNPCLGSEFIKLTSTYATILSMRSLSNDMDDGIYGIHVIEGNETTEYTIKEE